MKRNVKLLALLLVVIGFIACNNSNNNGNSNSNNSNVNSKKEVTSVGFERMPKTISTFAYVNVEKLKGIEMISGKLNEIMPEGTTEIIDDINEIYAGISEISKEALSERNADKIAEESNYIVMMSGKFNKENIKKMTKEKNPEFEEVKIAEIDGLKDKNGTLLFINESTIIVTSPNFENTAIESYNGKNTVDQNKPEYKAIKEMKSNLLRFVTDLTPMGKINLSELVMLLQGETSFGITKIGLENQNESFTLELSSVLDNNEVATNIGTSLKSTLQMGKMMVGNLGIEGDLKEDIYKIIEETEFKAEKNTLSTKIIVKESTINQLESFME